MNKQYVVTLTDEERQSLRDLVSRGKASARAIEHALILLKADVAEGLRKASASDGVPLLGRGCREGFDL